MEVDSAAAGRTGVLERMDQARRSGRHALDEPSAKRLLESFGIAVPRGEVAADAAAARRLAARLTAPLAAKLVSPDAIHKSDIGGVLLSLQSPQEVESAVLRLAEAAADHALATSGYLIEEMAPAGCELVVGGMIDPRFGPVIMLGLGGVFVEIFADTAFRVCPIDETDARDMIDQLQAAPLLRGARGREPVSEEAIVACLLAVGGDRGLMMTLRDEVSELDINPLMVSVRGAVACDARIVLRRPEAASE
jgi:acetyl-CoA synthetase (ADP-forming)